MCMRLAVVAADCMTWTPTAVDPVKDTIETAGCPTRAAPATDPRPVSTLTTPSGMPASVHAWANMSEVSGVISAGFRTIVLPAAIAGRIFHAAICSG